jgi:hypothetical protein
MSAASSLSPEALVSYYREPVKVTVAFIGLYFSFLAIQSGSKFYAYNTQTSKDGKEKVNAS